MKEDGSVCEQYDIENSEGNWINFRDPYLSMENQVGLEISTSGKYVARTLVDMGFSVHVMNPSKFPQIFQSVKKNDREDSFKIADLLRMGEIQKKGEIYIPSPEINEMRSLTRYRRSISVEMTMLKNKTHAILSGHGTVIESTDIFGTSGMRKIIAESTKLPYSERIVLSDIISRVSSLKASALKVEDEMARMTENNEDIRNLLSIPGINIYSAVTILSEIGNKEHLASYAGLVPRQFQSGNRDVKGHITKQGPSMLRYILVLAAHSLIKYSKKMRKKYLSIVHRLGKNRSIVTIARLLIEIIFTMLMRHEKYEDENDALTERKIRSMSMRARKERPKINFTTVKLLKEGKIMNPST
ncbi:MAG: transposase, ISliN1 [Ferroplasma sp. Type II]|nr:MAG: transposase, ISliN1 [Ferroplasma sp. Type II]